jgi:hypothetical protein
VGLFLREIEGCFFSGKWMPRRTVTTCLRAVLLMSGAVALATAGCGPSGEEQQRNQLREEFRDSFAHRDPTAAGNQQEVSHPKRVVVAQGRSPVVYDVRTPALAHVMDLTSGTELIAVNVTRDQWVSVNEENGILVGSRHILPGPLPSGHEFAILLDVGGDESYQSQAGTGAVPERPPTRYEVPAAPKPTTQPVNPLFGQPGDH